MRIDINNLAAQQLAAERASKTGEKSGNASVSKAEDHATLSESSLSQAALIQGALATPPARAERVAALRDAIHSGTYKLNPDAMAHAMLKEAGQ